MDMRSLEHCLNDITNTAGVQSDLKGELLTAFLQILIKNPVNPAKGNPREKLLIATKAQSLLNFVYKRLTQTSTLMRLKTSSKLE